MEGGDDIERQRHQFEAEIERHQALAEIIISMPSVDSRISTGNSNWSIFRGAEVAPTGPANGRADQHQHLHEAGEGIVDEGFVEDAAPRLDAR